MQRLKILFTLLFVFVIQVSFGQLVSDQETLDKIDPEVNLSTPYHTTLTFFINLEDNNFNPEESAKALNWSNLPEGDRADLSIKLKQIFEGNGVAVRTSQIPNKAEYLDSLAGNEPVFYFDRQILPSIFLTKVEDQWLFSSYSVGEIERLHDLTYPYGTAALLDLLPKAGNDKYLGLYLWQIIGLGILILFVFITHWLFTWLVDRGLLYIMARLGYGSMGEQYLLPVAKVTSIYLIVIWLSLFIRVLQLPIEIWSWLVVIFRILKPLLITVIFYKIVDVIAAYFVNLATKTESTLDDQLVPLLRKTLKAFVIVIGTLFILRDGLNLDIIPFLTGLSIGGVAIALAAQDTIKNFFGSIMIFVDRPFQVGDWITSGEVDGTVEEVGFRSTRVRTFRNSVTYIPNGKIADATVDNHGLRQYRRFYTTITITYDTPPELVEQFIKGLREIVLAHPNTRKDYFNIYFNNLSSFSLDIMFYVFFEVPTWPMELQARHELLIQIMKLAEALGVRFAFPTQTLHMESFPEKKELAPDYSQESPESYQKKLGEFVQKELHKRD